MGYYTGSGETTGGGSEVSLLAVWYIWGNENNIYQQRTYTTVRKAGVSLATAQAAGSEASMTGNRFSSGLAWYFAQSCKGWKTTRSYSQINGSNLYELTETREQLKVRLNNNGWIA